MVNGLEWQIFFFLIGILIFRAGLPVRVVFPAAVIFFLVVDMEHRIRSYIIRQSSANRWLGQWWFSSDDDAGDTNSDYGWRGQRQQHRYKFRFLNKSPSFCSLYRYQVRRFCSSFISSDGQWSRYL